MSFSRVAAVITVIGCTGVSTQTGVASPELRRPGAIKITARQIQRYVSGTHAGDVEVTRLRLYNRRITEKSIGHGQLVCTYIGDRTIRNCTGSVTLPKGQIVFGGTVISHDLYGLAVLGGTHIYGNVRGTLTVTALGGKPAAYLLLFRLVV
jgi:hypothetical protein